MRKGSIRSCAMDLAEDTVEDLTKTLFVGDDVTDLLVSFR